MAESDRGDPTGEPVRFARLFPDGRLAAAVVDRLTYRAHVIETGSDSYRLRATERARRGATRRAGTGP